MTNAPAPLRTAQPSGLSAIPAEANGLRLDPAADAFFFDVDGTLIDIADHPDAVVVPPALMGHLERLHQRSDGAVALVSGRTVERLDALFAPLRLPAAGAHGAEMRLTPHAPTERMAPAFSQTLRAEALSIARSLGDLFVEDKGASLAIHYRARPEVKARLGQRLAALAAGAVEPLTVLPGHFVFELKSARRDKGIAIDAFLQMPPFAGRRPVFIGDDVTDEAGFAAVRLQGGIPISVGRAFETVDVVLPRPADVRALVHRLSIT